MTGSHIANSRAARYEQLRGSAVEFHRTYKVQNMDEDQKRILQRIEGKVDALLGLVMLAFGLWCADRLTALFQRTFGWPRDLTFFLTAIVLYLGFVFWFERKYSAK